MAFSTATTFSNSASLAGAVYGPPLFDGGPATKSTLLPDQSPDGFAICNQGAMDYAKQTGEPFLAKGPDGALHWYRFQHGSTVGTPVLAFLGP